MLDPSWLQVSPCNPAKDTGPSEAQVFRQCPVLGGGTPVAVSATGSVKKPVNSMGGTRRRAEGRWPADPHWLLERALFQHRVSG